MIAHMSEDQRELPNNADKSVTENWAKEKAH